MPPTDLAIEATGLVKRFGPATAVGGVDLAVASGTVFGFLGRNGAGKTTTIRILATLTRPDAGTALVLGHDVVRQADQVRRRVSLTGQFAAVDLDLSAFENLVLVSRLLGFGWGAARGRAVDLLAGFGLADLAGRPARRLSGGERRRLDIAASLVVVPEVLFLDEPTTGLDPQSRNEVWNLIRSLAAGGTTVLLTTQYLEEADRLSDRVAVIDRGRIVAEGRPAELKRSVGEGTVSLRLGEPGQADRARAIVAASLGVEVDRGAGAGTLRARLPTGAPAEAQIARALLDIAGAGLAVAELSLGQPSLEEVFLALTGDVPPGAAPDPAVPAR